MYFLYSLLAGRPLRITTLAPTRSSPWSCAMSKQTMWSSWFMPRVLAPSSAARCSSEPLDLLAMRCS